MNAVLTGNRKWIVQVLSVVLAPQVIFYALFLAEGIVGGLAQGRLADRGAFVWWAQIVVVLSALSMFYSQKGEPAFRLTGRNFQMLCMEGESGGGSFSVDEFDSLGNLGH